MRVSECREKVYFYYAEQEQLGRSQQNTEMPHMRYSRSSSKHLLIFLLRYSRHGKYAIICYPQSTDPLPCGTPPDSGGEFLVSICATFRCLTCARHGKYTIICYPQSTDPLSCGTPPDSGGEFLVCSCATCDLPLLVLSKLFAFALNFNFVEVRLRSLQ